MRRQVGIIGIKTMTEITQNLVANEAPGSIVDAAKLRNAINLMDCLSQGAFEEIEMICSVCLTAMERPEFWRSADTIARALIAIKNRASDTMNSINSEAEVAGCNYEDDRPRRRHDAREAFAETREARVNSRKVSHA
jgi:hypothetical protein